MNSLLKEHVLDSIKGAVEALRHPAPNPMKGVFQMSAVYGALARVLNIEYEQRIAFAHFVIQHATQTVANQVSKILAGVEKSIELRVDLFFSLADSLEQFATKIESEEDFNPELQRIAEIAYTATGNGHYLYLKGSIVLAVPESFGEWKVHENEPPPLRLGDDNLE